MGVLADRIGTQARCVIDSYVAEFRPVAPRAGLPADAMKTRPAAKPPGAVAGDVQVTLSITYRAFEQPKADGFKFVGSFPIRNVRVTTASGGTLRHRVEQHKETLIAWNFDPPLQNGSETVRIEFTQKGAFGGTERSNHYESAWVGRFRVPTKDFTYRFVFPPGVNPVTVRTEPQSHELRTEDGERVCEVREEVPKFLSFSIWVEPGFVNVPMGSGIGPAGTLRSGLGPTGAPQSTSAWVGCLILFLLGVLVWVAAKAGMGGGGSSSGDGSSWSSGSSCSSCSSGSSCSSCGGGGGCGGCGG